MFFPRYLKIGDVSEQLEFRKKVDRYVDNLK